MPNSSRNSRRGCTKRSRKRTSTRRSRVTSLSSSQLHAIYDAITAPENASTTTWTGTFSDESLTNHRVMALVHSLSISLGSLCSILKYGTPSDTLRRRTDAILSSLLATVQCLKDLLTRSSSVTWTNSSGAGVQKRSSARKRKRG